MSTHKPVFIHRSEVRDSSPEGFTRLIDGTTIRTRRVHYLDSVVEVEPRTPDVTAEAPAQSTTNSSVFEAVMRAAIEERGTEADKRAVGVPQT